MGSIRMVDSGRAGFSERLTSGETESLVNQPDLRVLQCSSPVPDSMWSMLNARFFARRPDVQLRVFGFYSSECDLSFAGRMTNVHHFAADCLMSAQNVESVAEIPNLESLSLGIFELQHFSVLERVNPRLTELCLGATRSKKPDLAPLRRFSRLQRLNIEGQGKNIEVLSELASLEDVTLRSITTQDLSYLTPLSRMWSLDIKLGGIRSFAGIEGKESIKYLELWQIRELADVDIVTRLPGLQNLFLQSLPRIRALPSLKTARRLRRIVLQNMKGLADVSALEFAPALEEFALVEGLGQDPEQLLPALRNPVLRRASARFGSEHKNNRFVALLRAHGKETFQSAGTFEYQ